MLVVSEIYAFLSIPHLTPWLWSAFLFAFFPTWQHIPFLSYPHIRIHNDFWLWKSWRPTFQLSSAGHFQGSLYTDTNTYMALD